MKHMIEYTNEKYAAAFRSFAEKHPDLFNYGKHMLPIEQKIKYSEIKLDDYYKAHENFNNLPIFDSLIIGVDDSATKNANEMAKIFLLYYREKGDGCTAKEIKQKMAEKKAKKPRSLESAIA